MPSVSYLAAVSASDASAFRAWAQPQRRQRCRVTQKEGREELLTSRQSEPAIDRESSTMKTVLNLRSVSSTFSAVFLRIGARRYALREFTLMFRNGFCLARSGGVGAEIDELESMWPWYSAVRLASAR